MVVEFFEVVVGGCRSFLLLVTTGYHFVSFHFVAFGFASQSRYSKPKESQFLRTAVCSDVCGQPLPRIFFRHVQ